ncbi:hypothetical protein [Carnimonas bestiolae]|uniref:hypothetical protein n=1 Tax=Carnimonas bestiolae TaxID=3402172 RepID=UPI003EDC8F13
MLTSFVNWILAKRLNAVVVALIASILPWGFWLSGAIAALWTLRKGPTPALPVMAGAVVPTLVWAVQGNTMPLCGLVLIIVMSLLLRVTVSWSRALIGTSVVAALLIQSGILIPRHADQLLEQMQRQSPEVKAMMASYAEQGLNAQMLGVLVMGVLSGLVLLIVAFGVTLLARYWQARLFNPGGLREEFLQLRLTPLELLVVFGIALFGMMLGIFSTMVVVWLPLMAAGIALVHGVVDLKGINGLWAAIIDILVLVAWPVTLIVLLLALIDSFANIRARLASNKH